MTKFKYDIGDQFKTEGDGEVEVVDRYTRTITDEKLDFMYELKYIDQIGSPVSVEQESVLDDWIQIN